MPSYLRQWFIHRHGGNDPVTLRRGSIESKLLQRVTVQLPKGSLPDRKQEGDVAIQIPYSKSHDPRYYNHITETGKRAMLDRIISPSACSPTRLKTSDSGCYLRD